MSELDACAEFLSWLTAGTIIGFVMSSAGFPMPVTFAIGLCLVGVYILVKESIMNAGPGASGEAEA